MSYYNTNGDGLHEGDIVRVRRWEDMVDEYGVTANQSISVHPRCSFVIEMSQYCGRLFEVKSILRGDPTSVKIDPIEEDAGFIHRSWCFTPEMLEPIMPDEAEIIDVNTSLLMAILDQN